MTSSTPPSPTAARRVREATQKPTVGLDLEQDCRDLKSLLRMAHRISGRMQWRCMERRIERLYGEAVNRFHEGDV